MSPVRAAVLGAEAQLDRVAELGEIADEVRRGHLAADGEEAQHVAEHAVLVGRLRGPHREEVADPHHRRAVQLAVAALVAGARIRPAIARLVLRRMSKRNRLTVERLSRALQSLSGVANSMSTSSARRGTSARRKLRKLPSSSSSIRRSLHPRRARRPLGGPRSAQHRVALAGTSGASRGDAGEDDVDDPLHHRRPDVTVADQPAVGQRGDEQVVDQAEVDRRRTAHRGAGRGPAPTATAGGARRRTPGRRRGPPGRPSRRRSSAGRSGASRRRADRG